MTITVDRAILEHSGNMIMMLDRSFTSYILTRCSEEDGSFVTWATQYAGLRFADCGDSHVIIPTGDTDYQTIFLRYTNSRSHVTSMVNAAAEALNLRARDLPNLRALYFAIACPVEAFDDVARTVWTRLADEHWAPELTPDLFHALMYTNVNHSLYLAAERQLTPKGQTLEDCRPSKPETGVRWSLAAHHQLFLRADSRA